MSNLVKCKTCQKDVSINAPSCIHCGEPLLVHEKQVTAIGVANFSAYTVVIYIVSFVSFFVCFRLVGLFLGEVLGMPWQGALTIAMVTSVIFAIWLFTFLVSMLAIGGDEEDNKS